MSNKVGITGKLKSEFAMGVTLGKTSGGLSRDTDNITGTTLDIAACSLQVYMMLVASKVAC